MEFEEPVVIQFVSDYDSEEILEILCADVEKDHEIIFEEALDTVPTDIDVLSELPDISDEEIMKAVAAVDVEGRQPKSAASCTITTPTVKFSCEKCSKTYRREIYFSKHKSLCKGLDSLTSFKKTKKGEFLCK